MYRLLPLDRAKARQMRVELFEYVLTVLLCVVLVWGAIVLHRMACGL
jgi:hypothetical protein